MASGNANIELNIDNWKEEEEPQEAGVFVQADNKTMEGRVIKKAKRRGVKMTASMSKFRSSNQCVSLLVELAGFIYNHRFYCLICQF